MPARGPWPRRSLRAIRSRSSTSVRVTPWALSANAAAMERSAARSLVADRARRARAPARRPRPRRRDATHSGRCRQRAAGAHGRSSLRRDDYLAAAADHKPPVPGSDRGNSRGVASATPPEARCDGHRPLCARACLSNERRGSRHSLSLFLALSIQVPRACMWAGLRRLLGRRLSGHSARHCSSSRRQAEGEA